jgi:hypothetical protein
VAIDDAGVYWTGSACPTDGAACSNYIDTVSKSGGAPTTVAHGAGVGTPTAIAVGSTSLFFLSQGSILKLTPK